MLADQGVEVHLSVAFFINEPQWQDHENGVVVRGIGLTLEAADTQRLAAMGASFSVDIYLNEGEDPG